MPILGTLASSFVHLGDPSEERREDGVPIAGGVVGQELLHLKIVFSDRVEVCVGIVDHACHNVTRCERSAHLIGQHVKRENLATRGLRPGCHHRDHRDKRQEALEHFGRVNLLFL